MSDSLNQTLRPVAGGTPTVRWIERTGPKGLSLSLAAVPLDLAPVLREMLFDRVKTVVLTSATLAAGGEFDFLESRVGLSAEPSPVTVREILPSPFNYPEQCLFGIPNDVPDPARRRGRARRLRRPGDHRAGLGVGRRHVRAVHQPRRAPARRRRAQGLAAAAMADSRPGRGTRDLLLRRFREAGNAILLGTDSFWEGVDVPGRALRVLLICKLPFKVPSEPLTAARLERLAEQGEDGFMGYLLPHAALKLKQGFGRLIRTRTDAGVVILLDRRVVVKRYGPLLLSGLPRAERIMGSWAEVLTKCEDFFARHGIGASV